MSKTPQWFETGVSIILAAKTSAIFSLFQGTENLRFHNLKPKFCYGIFNSFSAICTETTKKIYGINKIKKPNMV